MRILNNGVCVVTLNCTSTEMEVENEMGIAVFSENESFLNGESKRNITLHKNVPTGIYYVKLTNDQSIRVVRMMFVQN